MCDPMTTERLLSPWNLASTTEVLLGTWKALSWSCLLVSMSWLCAGCDVEGQPCVPGECGRGFLCSNVNEFGDPQFICMRRCQSRADCTGGAICRAGASTDRVCWVGGTSQEGADCGAFANGDEPRDPCATGLMCSEDRGGDRCEPGCYTFSEHSADRVCPPGRLCDLESWNFPSMCLEECDPSDPNACDRGNELYCIRTDYPGVGIVGLCQHQGEYDFCREEPILSCGTGSVCVDHACYDPVDAPARPVLVSLLIPPLVD